jgi:hypothetical protein
MARSTAVGSASNETASTPLDEGCHHGRRRRLPAAEAVGGQLGVDEVLAEVVRRG